MSMIPTVNKSRNIKKLAKDKGEEVAKKLLGLEYYGFDSSNNSFKEKKGFMEGDPTKIRERRYAKDQEALFLDGLAKIIAMITAPTQLDRENVMDAWYDDIRIARENIGKFQNLKTDFYGFDANFDLAKKKRDYDLFVEYLKIICGEVERVLSKIEVKSEILVNIDLDGK